MITLALVAAALAVALVVVPPDRAIVRRLTPRPGREVSSRLVRRAGGLIVVAGVVTAAGLVLGARGVAVTVSVLAIAGTTGLVLRSTLSARRARQARGAVAHACQVLARLVAVGQTPAEALRTAAEDCPVLAEAASMQRIGGDPVSVWRKAAAVQGQIGLLALARAWQVSHATGAAMGRPLRDVADALRADRVLANVVHAELSAPRATGRLLALLPLAGLALGYLIGGDPVAFLLDNWVGQLCGVIGIALACGGVLWVERLAEEPGGSP